MKHVAVFRDGFFLSRDNGTSTWCGLPDELAQDLNEADEADLRYVAACDNIGAYFAKFRDGRRMWCTDGLEDADLFDAEVEANVVHRVAFCDESGSWVMLFDDGGVTVSDGVPRQLRNKLLSRNPRLPPASEVAIGPDGYWFVRWEDGKAEWMLPQDIQDVLDDVRDEGHRVTNLSFTGSYDYGCNYFIRTT